MLAGPAGIGKTAVATVVGNRSHGAGCLVVGVGARDSAAGAVVEVISALAAWSGSEIPGSLDGLDAQVDATLDLAAGFDGLLIVDGLATHHPEAERWLEEMAKHATGFRLLVTGRASPHNARAHGQTLVLGPLDLSSTRVLAESWAPDRSPEAHLRAARESRGHPAELQRLLRGAGPSSDEDDLLMRLLAAVGQPVPLAVIRVLAPGSSRPSLLASGQLRPVGQGFEPWRTTWAPPEAAEREQALRSLLLDGSAESTLAAIGLLARTGGAPERLRAILDERGSALLEGGHTARLWSALGELPAAELESWQLRCAERLGNPTVLARTHLPQGETPGDRLTWARTLLARGKPNEAHEFAAPLVTTPGPLAAEAALLMAEAAGRTGDPAEAVRTLDTIEPPSELDLAVRVSRCRWALDAGDSGAARSLGDLLRELEQGHASEDTWCGLAAAFERRGELSAALRALDGLERRRPGGAELFATRVALLIRARISVERGDPSLARTLADAVAPYSREPSALAPQRAAVELAARWLIGDLAEFQPALDLARSRTAGRDRPTSRRLEALDARLRCAVGETPEASVGGPGAPSVWAARWGAAPVEQATADRRDAVWQTLATASLALASGDVLTANEASLNAAGEAERWGFMELVLEAHALRAEALASSGELRGLAEAARDMARRAKSVGSDRFDLRARFFEAIASGRLDPATAELLAGHMATAPTVARWARSALGSPVALDRADTVLLAALREQGALDQIRTLGSTPGGGPWRPAWGLDLTERVVWLPDGQRIALGGRAVQWRILECLAAAEGLGVDKETLVREAWEVREYHPGRHDGRLYVAIRKLRAAIEDHPSEPTRLRTTDEGYALGHPVRIARAHPAVVATAAD